MFKRLGYVSILAILLVFQPIITANKLGEECARSEECEESEDLSTCGPENTCICNEISVPNNDNTTCLLKATIIGDPCTINTQCTQSSLGNQSYCDLLTGNVCRCNLVTSIPNPSNTKCLPIRTTIGATCEINEQCRRGTPGFNSLCKKYNDSSDQGTCQCDDYSVNEPGQNICLPIRSIIGDICSSDIQCTTNIGNLSECQQSSRTCQCKANEGIGSSDDKKCLKAHVPIRQPCEETAQCVGSPHSVCSTSKRCDCSENFVPSSPLNDCLPIVNQLGKECKESQQCSSGIPGSLSACIEGECWCTVNATSGQNDHVCRRLAMYVGDTCEITAQCTGNLGHGYCLGGICNCLSGAVISRDETKCLLKAYLGEECMEDNQCSHLEHSKCLRNATANTNMCQCDSKYMQTPSSGDGRNKECVKFAELIGETCEKDDKQCEELEGAECRGDKDEKKCLCDDENQIVSQNGKKCLDKMENLAAICEENAQCQVDNSFCRITDEGRDKRCVCQPNFIDNQNNRCLRLAEKYNDTCEETIQCDHLGVPGQLPCQFGKCQCNPPEGFYNKLCVKQVHLNEPCNNINECHFGINNLTLCIGKPGENLGYKFCQCIGNAMEGQDGLCYLPKPVGEKCGNDDECRVGIIGPVYCDPVKRVCTCENGFKEDTGGIRCSGGNMIFGGFKMIGLLFVVLGVLMLL